MFIAFSTIKKLGLNNLIVSQKSIFLHSAAFLAYLVALCILYGNPKIYAVPTALVILEICYLCQAVAYLALNIILYEMV